MGGDRADDRSALREDLSSTRSPAACAGAYVEGHRKTRKGRVALVISSDRATFAEAHRPVSECGQVGVVRSEACRPPSRAGSRRPGAGGGARTKARRTGSGPVVRWTSAGATATAASALATAAFSDGNEDAGRARRWSSAGRPASEELQAAQPSVLESAREHDEGKASGGRAPRRGHDGPSVALPTPRRWRPTGTALGGRRGHASNAPTLFGVVFVEVFRLFVAVCGALVGLDVGKPPSPLGVRRTAPEPP